METRLSFGNRCSGMTRTRAAEPDFVKKDLFKTRKVGTRRPASLEVSEKIRKTEASTKCIKKTAARLLSAAGTPRSNGSTSYLSRFALRLLIGKEPSLKDGTNTPPNKPSEADGSIGIMDQLWHNLHDMFDTDDGSLPEICIRNLSGTGVKDIWAYLTRLGASLNDGASFWHIAKDEDVPVDAVPNAAELVVSGEAASFHVCLRGIAFDGVVIPELGVFVFADSICLDYRMGPEWGPAQLRALFDLLRQLQSIDKDSVVTLPEEYNAEVRNQFAAAFAEYLKNA